MPLKALKTLPQGYRSVEYVKLPIATLSALSVVALIPFLPLFVALAAGLRGEAWLLALGRVMLSSSDLWVLICAFPLFIVHELLHGAVAWACGCRPYFGLKLIFAYTGVREGYFTLGQYVAFTLSPLVALTLLGALLIALVPGWSGWLTLYLTLNATGSVGDLWMLAKLILLPSQALIADRPRGFEVFLS